MACFLLYIVLTLFVGISKNQDHKKRKFKKCKGEVEVEQHNSIAPLNNQDPFFYKKWVKICVVLH